MDELIARLDDLAEEFADIETKLSDPATASDPSQLADLGRRHSELRPILADSDTLRSALTDAREAQELADAEEDKDMAAEFAEIATQRSMEAENLAEKYGIREYPSPANSGRRSGWTCRGGVSPLLP